jgi:hypothetical protein
VASNGPRDGNLTGSRLAEVAASFIVLLVLIGAEVALYGLERLSDDAADLIGVCAFGGVTIAAVRSGMSRGRSEVASLVLGVTTVLAVLHGAHLSPEVGPVAQLLRLPGNRWNAGAGLSMGILIGASVTVGAEAIQGAAESWKQTVAAGRYAVTIVFTAAVSLGVPLGVILLLAHFFGFDRGTQVIAAIAAVVVAAIFLRFVHEFWFGFWPAFWENFDKAATRRKAAIRKS